MSGRTLHLGHGPFQWVLDHVNENICQQICEVTQAVRGCVSLFGGGGVVIMKEKDAALIQMAAVHEF
jgi:hypothetical protein